MKHTGSLFLCLNAVEGDLPRRIQLLPAPDENMQITGSDGRMYIIEDPVAVAFASNRYLANQPIDENHSTDLAAPAGKPAPAFGWYRNITAERDGSLWADVEWNTAGEKAVRGKEYRYLSPALCTDAEGNIFYIKRAALTNNPNLKITQLNTSLPGEPAKENSMDKKICSALGLPETATDNDVLAAVEKLKTSLNAVQSPDLTKWAPRADVQVMEQRAVAAETKLTELNAAQVKATAETEVEAAVKARKIAPATKDVYVQLCSSQAGLEQFRRIVAANPEIIPQTVTPEGKPPEGGTVTALNADERTIAKDMGYSEEEYLKMKKEYN